jgi:photosystem II stability/assembly factor-like uncharacterized protein
MKCRRRSFPAILVLSGCITAAGVWAQDAYRWYEGGGSGGVHMRGGLALGNTLYALAGFDARTGVRLYEFGPASGTWFIWPDTVGRSLAGHGDTLVSLRDDSIVVFNRNTRKRIEASLGTEAYAISKIIVGEGAYLALGTFRGLPGTEGPERALLRLAFGAPQWTVDSLEGVPQGGPVPPELFSHGAEIWLAASDHLYKKEDSASAWEAVLAIQMGQGRRSLHWFDGFLYVGTIDSLVRADFSEAIPKTTTIVRGTINGIGSLGDSVLLYSYRGDRRIYRQRKGQTAWTSFPTGFPVYGFFSSAFDGVPALYGFGSHGGMIRSVDAGVTWTPMNQGLQELRVYSFAAAGEKLYQGVEGGVIMASPDQGASWAPVANYTSFTMQNDYPDSTVMPQLFGYGGKIMAILYNSVFRSSDGGKTWDSVGAGPSGYLLYPETIGSRVYAVSDAGLCVSQDGGTTWTVSLHTQGLAHSFAHEGDVFAVSDQFGGLYRSLDAGAHWQPLDSWAPTSVRWLSMQDGVILASANSLYRSEDSGSTWAKLPDPEIEEFPGWGVWHPTPFAGRYYGMINYDQLVVSRDGGSTWRIDSVFRSLAEAGPGPARGVSRIQAVSGKLYVGGYNGGTFILSSTPMLGVRPREQRVRARTGFFATWDRSGGLFLENRGLASAQALLILRNLRGESMGRWRVAFDPQGRCHFNSQPSLTHTGLLVAELVTRQGPERKLIPSRVAD